MPTASEIVVRALRKLAVVQQDDPVDPWQINTGVDALNGIMYGWEAGGLSYSHTLLHHADALATPPKLDDAIVYILADKLAPEYLTPPPPARDLLTAQQQVFANYLTVSAATIPAGLRNLPSQLSGGQKSR